MEHKSMEHIVMILYFIYPLKTFLYDRLYILSIKVYTAYMIYLLLKNFKSIFLYPYQHTLFNVMVGFEVNLCPGCSNPTSLALVSIKYQISFIAWKIRKIGEASADTAATETYYMKGYYNLEEETIKVKDEIASILCWEDEAVGPGPQVVTGGLDLWEESTQHVARVGYYSPK